ncbi:MAG: hypothetical protein GY795_03125 [Desulfobacterales bacterium]|nr:hypothetical protein [Desulfobacterales bacterium]
MNDQDKDINTETLQKVRENELVRENTRLLELSSLKVKKDCLYINELFLKQEEKKNVNLASSNLQRSNMSIYESSLERHQENIKKYEQQRNKYVEKYKRPYDNNLWRKEELDQEYTRFGLLFIPDSERKFKVYQSYLDENNKIIPDSDGFLGKLFRANSLDNELKDISVIFEIDRKGINRIKKNLKTPEPPYDNSCRKIKLDQEYTRFGLLFIPDSERKFKVYRSYLDERNEIIPDSDGKLGKLYMVKNLDNELESIILKHHLLMIFEIDGEDINLIEDKAIQDERKHNYHDNKYASIGQLLTLISGVISYLIITLHHISDDWVLATGILLPAIGGLFGNLSHNRSTSLSSNFKLAGNILTISSIFIALSFFYPELIPFSQITATVLILCVFWPFAAGIILSKSAKPLPEMITGSENSPCCDQCLGIGRIEKDDDSQNIFACDKCLGEGVIGLYIEREKEIRSILTKRYPVIIFTLLQPIVLSLAYISRVLSD